MVAITKVCSGGYYETKYHYSRIVMVDNWIFMANVGGVDPATGQLPPDPLEQAKLVISHIEHSLAHVGSKLSDVVRMVVNIPNRDHFFTIMDYVGPAFKGVEPARTMTCSPLGSEQLLLEIEITAYKGAGDAEQKRIHTGLMTHNQGFAGE